MVLLSRCTMRDRDNECKPGEGIEEGSRVVVLNGRHFPSFGAGDQGRVLQVDKEALNCDVLFDGSSRPIPVALRHLRLLKAGGGGFGGSRAQLPVSRVLDFKDGDGGDGMKTDSRGRAEVRGSSTSPRRSVSISVAEPVSADARREARQPSFLHSMDQRLQACEAALDGSKQMNYRIVKPGEDDVVRGSDLNFLEDRIQRLEQRIQDEVDVLTKRLQQATAFGQSWESRANSLERHIKSLGHVPPSPAPSSCSGLSARGSAPLYLSAAIPQQRLSATPPAKSAMNAVPSIPAMPPTPSTGPCVTQADVPDACSACGAPVMPDSRYCIKCGAGSGPSVAREPQELGSTRRSLSASAGQTPGPYVRGAAYLARAPDTTPPRAPRHVVPAGVLHQPIPPVGLVAPFERDAYGCSPLNGYVSGPSGPCFTPPPAGPAGQILTPRLVLPQRPFG
ncbi:FOLD2 [Symbiodinium natans]|uniref:FOLD2 protein n=1 Tax=Symbiodinium natans TaxID=878477 RepID=A0A812RH01_9DINO|nr:FOLD2 [Symbiodinium natans]